MCFYLEMTRQHYQKFHFDFISIIVAKWFVNREKMQRDKEKGQRGKFLLAIYYLSRLTCKSTVAIRVMVLKLFKPKDQSETRCNCWPFIELNFNVRFWNLLCYYYYFCYYYCYYFRLILCSEFTCEFVKVNSSVQSSL